MKSILTATAVLLLTASDPAVAASHPREARQGARPVPAKAMPMARAPAAITLPYQKFTLPNGLTTLVYTDHAVPTVFVGVWYRTGSKDEPPGKSGFAHLFEHLMFQQTANRKGEFLSVMEGIGATGMNGSTTTDYTDYFETVPTNALDMALWMESDRMGYLAGGITQTTLDEQRHVVENEKRQRESPEDEAASARFLSSYYPAGHPYAHTTIGSIKDLDAASLDDVKRWFADHYGASNAVLVLAGDIDLATARAKVSKYFGGLRAGKAIDRPVAWVPSFGAVRKDVLYSQGGGTKITRTWPVSNEDPRSTTMLLLAARTMTATRGAALTQALVEDAKVATRVDAQFETAQLDSRFTISMDLAPGVTTEQADAALDRILQRFFTDGPSPDGLASIRLGTETAILRAMDNNADVGNFLVDGELGHGDPGFFLKQRDWARATTPAEVAAAAKRWLDRPYYEQIQLPSPTATTQADVDRTQIPAPGPLKTTINLPGITEMRLANGLKLVVAERPRLPIVDMTMLFATGTAADRHYAPGAAAAAFALMRSGTSKLDAATIADKGWRLDVPLVPDAGQDASTFRWSAAPDRLAASFDMAAEMMRHSNYPAVLVDQAAAGTRQALNAPQDPVGRSDLLLAHAIYGDADPRGRLAKPEDYQALTRDAVVRFRDHEIGPSDATLMMVGDVTPTQAKALAERYFGDWQPNAPAAAAPPTTVTTAPQPRIILIDAPGAAQSSITIGDLAGPFDKDADAAEQLADAVLASGTNGRLNMDLREDKGWTYGFGGGIGDVPTGDRLFVAGGSVQTDKTAAAIAEIRKQIGDFVTTRPITEEEFRNSRTTAIRSIPLGLTGGPALLAAMTKTAQFGLPYDRIAGSADRLAAVTLDQTRAAAQRLYQPDRLVWVVVGDLKTIEPDIRKLNIAPVEVWDAQGKRLR